MCNLFAAAQELVMNKFLKWTLVVTVAGLILFVVIDYYVGSSFGFDDGNFYSKQDLIDNYNNNQSSINQLKDFYNKLVPADKIVEIEFKDNKVIDRLAVTNLASKSKNYSDQYFCEWDLKVNSLKVDSIITSLGWTKGTLTEIKSLLDKSNCISVKNGEPAVIGFKRSGLGMYLYDLFSNSIPDSLRSRYNDSCTHIIYSDKIALEYGGGAVGPQCFSNH